MPVKQFELTDEEWWEAEALITRLKAKNRHDFFIFLLKAAKEKIDREDEYGKRPN